LRREEEASNNTNAEIKREERNNGIRRSSLTKEGFVLRHESEKKLGKKQLTWLLTF